MQAVENTLNGGVVFATSGIVHSSRPRILDANCVLWDVAAGLLGASAFFTADITLGVVAGVTITWGMVFGASAAITGALSPDVSC